MPVHNAERFLRDAIDSILHQTIQGLELICVDDGSTDRSPTILERARCLDPRVTVITQQNQGVAPALNAGLARAKAPFIARMDADDIASPHRLARQLLELRSRPAVVALGTWYRRIDERGHPIESARPPIRHAGIVRGLLAGDPGVLRHPTVVMRRHAVSVLSGYDPSAGSAEDVDLFLRLARLGELANLADPLLDYRVHAASVTQSRSDTQRADLNRVVVRATAAQRPAMAS